MSKRSAEAAQLIDDREAKRNQARQKYHTIRISGIPLDVTKDILKDTLTGSFGEIIGISFEVTAIHAISQLYWATVTFEDHPDALQVQRELQHRLGNGDSRKFHVDEHFRGLTPLYTPGNNEDTRVE